MAMEAGWPDSDFVFTHADGRPLWPQMVTARFRSLCLELDLPLIGVHGLRHTSATPLIAPASNPRVVQQRLDHAQVSITLGLYTAVLPAHDREAADVVGRALAIRSWSFCDHRPMGMRVVPACEGGPPGSRTLHLGIKSPLLYPMS